MIRTKILFKMDDQKHVPILVSKITDSPMTRQMLGIEERKEEARNGLETAGQSRNVEMLEDALEEAASPCKSSG